MVCAKVLDLATICDNHTLTPDEWTAETRVSHKEWVNVLFNTYSQLEAIEVGSKGKQGHISKAFEVLVLTS